MPMDDDPVIYTAEQELEAARILEPQTPHNNVSHTPSDDVEL